MKESTPLPTLQVRIEDAARMLSMSPRSVRRLIADGKLPSVGRGRLRRIAVEDLHRFIDKNREVRGGR
jgi:excisionase family DNA binding protein